MKTTARAIPKVVEAPQLQALPPPPIPIAPPLMVVPDEWEAARRRNRRIVAADRILLGGFALLIVSASLRGILEETGSEPNLYSFFQANSLMVTGIFLLLSLLPINIAAIIYMIERAYIRVRTPKVADYLPGCGALIWVNMGLLVIATVEITLSYGVASIFTAAAKEWPSLERDATLCGGCFAALALCTISITIPAMIVQEYSPQRHETEPPAAIEVAEEPIVFEEVEPPLIDNILD